MAGFSIVLLWLILLWPVVLVCGIVGLVAMAAAEFVTSPAFPLLVVSFVFGCLAAADVLRLLWCWHKQRDGFVFDKKMLVRPLVLAGIAFALFVVMCVVTGSLILAWYQGLAAG